MIFNSNTTALSASTIPMAEGYDCSFGASLALVESARNDLSMFQALVQADYKEMRICKESTGVVQEGEISALHEAVGGGIFKKIAELFKKLVAKIKAIFHSFMAKINGIAMKDKDLVKKYQGELSRKRNLDKLEVKFRKPKKDAVIDFSEFKKGEGWKEENWDRVKFYLGKDVDSVDEFVKETIADCLEDEDTLTLGEVGGWREMAKVINEYSANIGKEKSKFDKEVARLEKLVKEYDKAANEAAKASVADKDNADKTSAVETANKEYDMAQAYQTATLAQWQAYQKVATINYKQCKAAFVKAISVNEKKLEESSILVDALVEAAEEEVDNVITNAISDEELSDLTVASTDVKDADVSDDPDKLTYGPDCYTDSPEAVKDGEIDTDINSKEESAFFGKMFY